MSPDRSPVTRWVQSYVDVWRAPGTERLAEIFTDDASYLPSPWREPIVGLDALAEWWEQERDGPDEQFQLDSDVVAVDGDTAVVRVEVAYGTGSSWRDLWVLRFAPDGRCASFEEWPFSPTQRDGHES